MKSSVPPDASSTLTGRHQRRARNYLIDPRFQLKYAGFLVGVAVLLSVGLGLQLARTGTEVIDQSQRAVEQGRTTVQRGTQMIAESRKVSAVVSMSIAKDPVYADNPELASLFKENAADRERQLDDEQKRLEADAAELSRQSSYLALQQRKTLWVLFGGLSVLVIAIGLAGVFFTHKIAGPVHKMKGLLRRVGEGKLHVHAGLRKGDELQHFFDAFVAMVEALRKMQAAEVERLDRAITGLEGEVEPVKLTALRELRADMQSKLDD
jgi:nitrogen fixation/metabolism regulation signal transduction histidine kinase